MFRRILLASVGVACLTGSAFAVPSDNSRKPILPWQIPAFLGDCTSTAGSVTLSCANTLSPGTALDVSKAASVAAAIATGKPLYFPPGNWSLTGGYLTVPSTQPMWFAPGAVLSCPNGMGINSTIFAARVQIFSSTCLPSLYSNKSLGDAPVEWWGAKADSTGATGNGTDNFTPFSNAEASGASSLSFGNGSYRMAPLLTSTRQNLVLEGRSRNVSKIFIDDPAGINDGLYFSNGSGRIKIQGLGIYRIQATTGGCAYAYPVTPGAGYVPGELLTTAGGTFTAACQLTVASTLVGSASVASSGSGGTPGPAIVVGTTGTGTLFQANVTIGGGGSITAVNSIAVNGAYTANPTTLPNEPVTGGGLTGAALNVTMGVNALAIATAGVYTAGPLVAATQSATNGAGSGATFRLTLIGPADLHIEDSFRVDILNNEFGAVGKTWDAIRVNSSLANTNKITIERNTFNGGQNDGIFVSGTAAKQTADIYIRNNYVYNQGRAGEEFYGSVSGASIEGGTEYASPYAVIADVGALPQGSIGVLKIQGTEEDTNTMGSYWRGVGASIYTTNWHSSGGRWTCELCADIQAQGGLYVGNNSGVNLLGSLGVHLDGSQFSQMVTAVTFGLSGTTDNTGHSIVGASHINVPGGAGHLLGTISGSPSNISASLTSDGTSTLYTGAFTSLTNLVRVFATWADNQPCIPGMTAIDASYEYVCTALNHVKRGAALSDF